MASKIVEPAPKVFQVAPGRWIFDFQGVPDKKPAALRGCRMRPRPVRSASPTS